VLDHGGREVRRTRSLGCFLRQRDLRRVGGQADERDSEEKTFRSSYDVCSGRNPTARVHDGWSPGFFIDPKSDPE
jgi:hypothetical protein